MRRLAELKATRLGGNNGGLLFQNNRYSYDLVGNILSVENAVSLPSTLTQLGGSSKYTYEYDELNRLIKARGVFEGTRNKADYELNMQYNRLNGIVQKALQYRLNGQDKGYTLNYEYNDKNHPHAPSSISGISGAVKPRSYQYDGNGNPLHYEEDRSFRSMVWDEENRLRGINDNGRLHLYTYDHTGERALKSSAESSLTLINGATTAVVAHNEDYTAYISPYFVVQKGKFTKHYFEGSSRVVSKLGEGTFSQNKPKITAGGIDYMARTRKEQEARDEYIKGLNTPPGPPTQHGIYASPEWTGQPYPSIDWSDISQDQEPPEGWPRPPKFNEPGDVPGPPVQYGEAITNANVKAGFNFVPNGVEEKNLYFYHPDHLGSSSYITDKNGEIIQHTEYIAFGETFVDEHSVNPRQPYLFNGKELDMETGLYYYGARYYDPKTSIFLNVDPLTEKTGTPYAYTYNNPINLIDPDGREGTDWYQNKKTGNIEWKDTDKQIDGYIHLGRRNTIGITGKGQDSRMYYLNANGSVTEKTGDGRTKLDHIEGGKSLRTIAGTTITSKRNFWDSDLRRTLTGDKVGFSVGVDATAFLGVNLSFDFDWVLTGRDASVFPYFGVTTGLNLANGFNGSVDVTFNKAWFSGSVSQVRAADIPGTSYGASIGGKYIVGADIGYSYSKSGNYGWHQLNVGVGAGLEFSPSTGANIKTTVGQQWFNIHTKTGKINYSYGNKK